MGHAIPTSQMQYHTDYKETDKKKINAAYNLEETVHISNICTKANRTIGFPRRNLSACPQDVKVSAYKDLCAQSWSIVVQFGTPQVYFFKRNLKRYRKGQLDL